MFVLFSRPVLLPHCYTPVTLEYSWQKNGTADGAAPYLMPSGRRTQGHAEHMCGPTAVCQGKPSEMWEASASRMRVTETEHLKPHSSGARKLPILVRIYEAFNLILRK